MLRSALIALALLAGQVDPKLDKARKALELSALTAAQALAKVAKDERVACLDLRPSTENSDVAAHAPALFDFALAAFLKEGVLAYPLEREKKLDVPYKSGKLSRQIPLSPADLKALSERKTRYLLFPQLLPKDGNCAVTFDVFDLQKGNVALSSGFGAVPTKTWPLEGLVRPGFLPPLNARVLSFAAANFDKQVDRGECWDLAANPVKAGGGKVEGYKFGQEVKWEDARPGDVVTFGTSGETGGHVMVLFRWNAKRGAATILHQNVGNVRRVMLGSLADVESAKAGQPFAVWRP